MHANRKSPLFLLAALFAVGCIGNGSEAPTGPVAVGPVSGTPGASSDEKTSLYPVIAEVPSGRGKVSFLDAGENRIFLTQIIDADQESLIKPSMEGLTYAEIFGLLAPGRPVPEALKRATDRFSMGTAIGSRDPNAGQAETSAVPGALAKSAGQWDLWFQQKRATVPEDSIGLKDMEKDRNGDHVAYLNVRFSGVRTYETIVAFIRAVALLERERITGFLENASRKRGAVGFRITHDEAEARTGRPRIPEPKAPLRTG